MYSSKYKEAGRAEAIKKSGTAVNAGYQGILSSSIRFVIPDLESSNDVCIMLQ